jgi:hypothetical protein
MADGSWKLDEFEGRDEAFRARSRVLAAIAEWRDTCDVGSVWDTDARSLLRFMGAAPDLSADACFKPAPKPAATPAPSPRTLHEVKAVYGRDLRGGDHIVGWPEPVSLVLSDGHNLSISCGRGKGGPKYYADTPVLILAPEGGAA